MLLVDAVSRSYPLIHPRYVFFEPLGQTKIEIISEEKRLFYVAMTRAKKSLVIFTEKGNESPFLKDNILSKINLKILDINRIPPPKRKGNHYAVSIYNKDYQNNGTYKIKSYLRENSYQWNPAKRVWIKYISAKYFSKERLLSESWIKNANNISILVSDKFGNQILLIDIEEGKITSKELGKAREN